MKNNNVWHYCRIKGGGGATGVVVAATHFVQVLVLYTVFHIFAHIIFQRFSNCYMVNASVCECKNVFFYVKCQCILYYDRGLTKQSTIHKPAVRVFRLILHLFYIDKNIQTVKRLFHIIFKFLF